MNALRDQIEALRVPAKALARRAHFPVGTRVQRTKDALKARSRVKVKHLILKENARALVAQGWPALDERVWAIVPGDFVFGELVPAVMEAHGAPEHLWLSTLSLSAENVEMLREVLRVCPVSLLVSNYFKSTSAETFGLLESLRGVPGWSLAVARIHTKLMLFDYPGCPVVLEGSANLRSNNSYEQVALHQDAPLFFFYRSWMQELWTLADAEGGSALIARP